MAVPAKAAIERRLKKGRGFADEDGGGGIYKGKPQNKRDSGTSVDKDAGTRPPSKKRKKKKKTSKELRVLVKK